LLQLAPNAPSNQVLLRVRFAEVSRSALTQLGVGFFTSPTGIKNTVARTTTQQFPAPDFSNLQSSKASSNFGSAVTSASGSLNFSDFLNLFLFNEKYDLGAVIKALQNHGLFQSLAEPNLVAESGKEASFLAGGEFPVPVPQASAGGTAITVQYKEFGIRLNFTPIVNGNRVHLKLRPEVSTLDFGNAITLQGFKIPALSTRRTETEIELDNNQTFAIAGLMNNQVSQTMSKIPGIGDIPILGLLFKSKEAQKDQTQLVVMITPEILPLNSSGVTTTLPRQAEPYLPPLPDKKSFEPPAPAFPAPPAARPDAEAQPAPTAGQPDPQAAADAMKALSPLTRAPNVHAAPTPGPGEATQSNRESSSGTSAADPASNVPATSTSPAASVAADAAVPATAADAPTSAGAVQQQLSDADKKAAQEQAKKDKQVQQRQAALARQKAAREAKAAKKAHDAELRRQAAERKAAQKKAAEDARKAKEAAQKAKEQAEKEEEAREKRDKEIAEAQAKIQAAETAFLEETSKRPNE
jgi:hypothetical protein